MFDNEEKSREPSAANWAMSREKKCYPGKERV